MNIAASVLGLLALSTIATTPWHEKPVCALSISRNVIYSGEYVAIGWSAQGGISHNINVLGGVERSGSFVFQPATSIRYDFTVDNQFGRCVDSKIVQVLPRPQEQDDFSVFARLISGFLHTGRGGKSGGVTPVQYYEPYAGHMYYSPTYINMYPSPDFRRHYNQDSYLESSFYHPDQRRNPYHDEKIYDYAPFNDGSMHRVVPAETQDVASSEIQFDFSNPGQYLYPDLRGDSYITSVPSEAGETPEPFPEVQPPTFESEPQNFEDPSWYSNPPTINTDFDGTYEI